MIGWLRDSRSGVLTGFSMPVWINSTVGRINERLVRGIYRNQLGDWCAEVDLEGRLGVEVFDYHPSIAVMRVLREAGTEIAEEVLDQGAEGEDMRWRAILEADR